MAVFYPAFHRAPPSALLHPRPSSPRSAAPPPRHPFVLRCSAEKDGAPALLKLAVGGATELLRLLGPKKQRVENREEEAIVIADSVDDVVDVLRFDYRRAYFLTGNFTLDIYAEDCLFEDPTITFKGKSQYKKNLDLLVPFLDSPSLMLENIEKGSSFDKNFIVASWTLRTYLKFPWRPFISINGSTIYDLDKDFKIVRHAESWSISALEAIAQIFAVNSSLKN